MTDKQRSLPGNNTTAMMIASEDGWSGCGSEATERVEEHLLQQQHYQSLCGDNEWLRLSLPLSLINPTYKAFSPQGIFSEETDAPTIRVPNPFICLHTSMHDRI